MDANFFGWAFAIDCVLLIIALYLDDEEATW